jgi:sortase A
LRATVLREKIVLYRFAIVIERFAFATGLLLLTFVAVALVHRSMPATYAADIDPVAAQNAIEALEDAAQDDAPDTSLWSQARLTAYREAARQLFASPVAELSVPELDLVVPVFEGTSEPVLNRGAGRIEGTNRIGDTEGANIGIAAHRDGYFRKLKDIKLGQSLELQQAGTRYRYTVSDIRIVDPGNVSVLDRDESTAKITLVTCYPFYFIGSAPERYIVTGELSEVLTGGLAAQSN